MFAIQVELLTGRYYASRYNDRSRAEWPPHPARLFSALVATHYAQQPPNPAERSALEWLERLSPPELSASLPTEVADREPHTVFVPVNDPTVLGDLESARAALAEAEAEAATIVQAGQPLKRGSPGARALAKVEKLRKALADKVARAVAPADKVSKDAIDQATRLFPEHRTRQPRNFPSVHPQSPLVTFVWPEAEAGDHRPALEQLLSRAVRLGHSASLVRMRLLDDAPQCQWRPDPEGHHRLRVTREGQLQALDEAFALHQETQPRLLPAAIVSYTCDPPRRVAIVPASSLSEDWVVLRKVGGPVLPSTAVAGVAKTIRRALMSFSSQPAPEILTGHSEGGRPSSSGHLAIIGLPFVGHAHADGLLLGFALVLPRGASPDQRKQVFRALAAWEAHNASDTSDVPAIAVHLGAAGEVRLQRLEDRAERAALRPGSWCGPAKRWATATPVALDHNPGELRDRNPEKQASAIAEAKLIVAEAFHHIGLPSPARITIFPAAPLVGARKAKWFPPYPEGAAKVRRVLTHVGVEFDEPVSGPMVIGAGRYHGLGLLKPVTDDE